MLEIEADRVTSLRALPGTVAYALLALGFSLTTELGSRFPRFSLAMTAASFVAGAVRFRVLRAMPDENTSPERRATWRRATDATSFVCVGLWALHVSLAIRLLGIGMTTILMMMASVGLVVGVAHALSPRRGTMRICIAILIAPTLVATLAAHAYGVASLVSLQAVYALYLGHRLGVEYWKSAIGREQLRIGRDELILSQRKLAASERLASLGRLAAGVGHEINNPLTYVLANLESALADLRQRPTASVEQQQELVELVAESLAGAERVRVIVRDLRIFSEAEETTPTPVHLNRVIELAIKRMAGEVRPRARLACDLSPAIHVMASETKLGQVFEHLLRNAAQAIPEGHPEDHEVRITTKLEGSSVVVEVHDTGAGISTAHVGRVFDPFFTTRPVGSGTGLGLSICHASVRSFGGDIAVSTEVSTGTTIVIRLPVASAAAVRAPSVVPPEPAERRGRILVIDDEVSIGSVLRRSFGQHHDIVFESSGARALARIEKREAFDLVLCDLMMPEMTGMELFARVTQVAPDYVARFVFMTGGAFTPSATEFLERVTNPRIEKPFKGLQLKAVFDGLRS